MWQVFIQRAAVNLLSTVLDTPEFFWSAPDIMQTLYKRICEYMELDDRVEVLNNRFSVRAPSHLLFPPNVKHTWHLLMPIQDACGACICSFTCKARYWNAVAWFLKIGAPGRVVICDSGLLAGDEVCRKLEAVFLQPRASGLGWSCLVG